MFDVIIIGAGVIGCSIARELTKYTTNIAVIEKENDVCEVTSKANSAIVHSGYDPEPGTLKAKLNVLGNNLFDKLSEDLDFEFKRIGSLTIARSIEDIATLRDLKKRAETNGVPVEIVSREELVRMEPFISDDATGALFAPTCGIVNPFEYTIALMENAMDNGAKLYLNNIVQKINKIDGGYEVITNKDTYTAKCVVNAAGLNSDKIAALVGNNNINIKAYKGEYYVLDHFEEPFVNHTIFPLPSKVGKGILVSPTTHGNYLVGPNSNEANEDDFTTTTNGLYAIKAGANTIVKNIPFNQVIRSFAGLRAKDISGDFVIKEDENNKGFIQVAGIQSPGLASSPAIALYVVDILKKCIKLGTNENFNPKRRPLIRLNKKSLEERSRLIKENPLLGHIICRCEKVSEGEIVDIIHRNCGATTINGIKKRVRPGFGKCQGGFCEPLCLEILARELKKNPLDVRFSTSSSYILAKDSKEGK